MQPDETTTEALDAEVTTPTVDEKPALAPDAIAAELERARKEAAKYRTQLRAIEEKQKAAEDERLKQAPLEERLAALEAERNQLAAAAEESALAAARERALRNLANKVRDPEAALVVAQAKGMILEDGSVNVEALLEAAPYFATEPAKTTAPAPMGAPTGASGRKFSADDLRRMTPEQINELWPQIASGSKG
jgi:murein DD-endopeptidase MepM/ murein hydrolase activator NlpD